MRLVLWYIGLNIRNSSQCHCLKLYSRLTSKQPGKQPVKVTDNDHYPIEAKLKRR